MVLREKEWLLAILGKGGEQLQSSLCVDYAWGKLISIFSYAKPSENGKQDRKGMLYAILR